MPQVRLRSICGIYTRNLFCKVVDSWKQLRYNKHIHKQELDMRKIIVAVLLAVASLSASALTQWQVTTNDSTTGALITYTVLPATAAQASDNPNEWRVIIETETAGQPGVARSLVFVNGCIERYGQTMWTTLQRKIVFPVSDWILGGTRVFDLIANLTCAANYENFRERMPQPSTGQQKKAVSEKLNKST